MPDFATFAGGATAIATDGVNVYVMGNTPNVITAVSIATMNTSTVAINSANGGQGNLATDGTNLYISGSNVYRVPVTAMSVDLSMETPMFSATALGENTVTGLQVDDTNLYISTVASVYKTKK